MKILYLKKNLAYQFSKLYSPEKSNYEKIFKTNKSTLVIGMSYSFLRKNGNYIIQIEGFPNKDLDTDKLNLFVDETFIKNWYSISVFIINEDFDYSYNFK